MSLTAARTCTTLYDMAKTAVYSWRLSSERRDALEREARREGVSVAQILDRIAEEWLTERGRDRGDDAVEQERLRRAALACAGTIHGRDPHRSETVGAAVRARLARRRAT